MNCVHCCTKCGLCSMVNYFFVVNGRGSIFCLVDNCASVLLMALQLHKVMVVVMVVDILLLRAGSDHRI